MTYGKLLKRLLELNPLELEEDVIIMNENTKAIHALREVRTATNYLVIGEFERLENKSDTYRYKKQHIHDTTEIYKG